MNLPAHPSASFIKRNPSIYDHSPRRTLQDPEPQRDQAPALGQADERKVSSVGMPVVRFIGYRCRPLDSDNFSASVKDLLDGLRRAKLLDGDEPWRIRLETEQVKVRHRNEERTEIFITYP